MAQYQLPGDFFFGAAMSGPQTEGQWNQGGKLENLWDTWSIQDLGSFYNCVGSYAGNDFMAKYQEDLRILKDLGLNTYRTSIQWSRLLDADGNLNEEGAAWYHELFRASREAGLSRLSTCTTLICPPTSLTVAAGRAVRSSRLTRITPTSPSTSLARRLSTGSPLTSPSSSPNSAIKRACGSRSSTTLAAPAPCSITFRWHMRWPWPTIVAPMTRGAIRADAKIGMINCFTPVYTKQNPSEADLEAVRMTSGINNRWWLDLITKGELPADVLDSLAEGGVKLRSVPATKRFSSGVVDWLGCNYYHPRVFRRRRARSTSTACRTLPTVRMARRRYEREPWLGDHPQGLYDFGMDCAKNYPDLEWFVSENGIGIMDEYKNRDAEGTIQDDYRVDFVRQHLEGGQGNCRGRQVPRIPLLGRHR